MDDLQTDVLADFLQTNDGLSKVASLFSQVAGRELSSDALQCIVFLKENGSPDLAAKIMADKLYQLDVDKISKFTKELSAATAVEKQMEMQTSMMKSMRT